MGRDEEAEPRKSKVEEKPGEVKLKCIRKGAEFGGWPGAVSC